MKIRKDELIGAYAQSIGIKTAIELIDKKIEASALENKKSYTGEEVARICNELANEEGLIRIIAQSLLVQLERKKAYNIISVDGRRRFFFRGHEWFLQKISC